MSREELAAFLRSRRARLQPGDAGLPETGVRRTPGLRRQEVAQLAGISVDYYIRLEQGRGARPSNQVLYALGRALMLTIDEREYLFRIADRRPPAVASPTLTLPPSFRHLLDGLPMIPAYVVDAKYDILAWNRLMTYFIGDPDTVPAEGRNVIRWIFAQTGPENVWSDEQMLRFARTTVADLRAAYARYPGEPGIASLVTELLGTSPAFAEMWAAHDVEVRGVITKRIDHPEFGTLEFACEILHVQATDQRLILYCAEPGTATHAAFARMAVAAQPAG
ncbi:helix-turn-helix transcriptional regulator [Kibdelosporangium aridum]|uniref:helix-turn-helix transcriptional regulator n=1 Tax=Kibdelosporangium aridum TaxID=2030 RepID=UPI0005264CE1